MARFGGTKLQSLAMLFAAALLSVSAGACGKKDGDAAKTDNAGDKGAGDKGKPAGDSAKAPAAAGGVFDSLPADTGLVVGFSWSKFKDTNYFKMLEELIPAEGKGMLVQL